MWRKRNLTLEGKMTVFTSVELSKIIFLPQALLISKVVISTIEKIQKQFIWKDFRPKINFRQFVILTKKED